MGKKSRRDRGVKEKKLKDEPARIKAVEVAKKKIEELGLSPEVEGIKQFYVNIGHHDFKYDCLCDLFEIISVSQTMIYCNSKNIVYLI